MENFQYIGSKNLIPSEYKVIGYAYSAECGDGEFEAEVETDDFVLPELVKMEIVGMVHGKTTCNHCNGSVRNVIIAIHNSGSFHVFGTTCGNHLSGFSAAKFDNVKEKTLAQMRKKQKANKISALFQQNAGLEEALDSDNKICKSIKENLLKYAELSDKQIALAFKMAEQTNKFKELNAIKNATSSEVTEGKLKKQKVTIISKKVGEFDGFGGVKEVKAVLVLEHELGFRLYGKINMYPALDSMVAGDSVLFTGTVTKSDKDPYFGFFKRGGIEVNS